MFNGPSCKQVAIFEGFSAEVALRIVEMRWEWLNELRKNSPCTEAGPSGC